MNKATLIKTIQVDENGVTTHVEIYKHENGYMFGVDSSYVDQLDDDTIVFDPIDGKPVELIE